MAFVGIVILWLIAATSFVSMAISIRFQVPIAWLSGFFTAVALLMTMIVVMG